MENKKVLRSQQAQAVSIFFGLILLVFLTQVGNRSASVKDISLIVIAFCAVGVVRSWRSGYVAIESQKLVVRTLFRTKTFELKNIRTVEARTIVQVTPRVMPVLNLTNGESYKLSEFFMQKRAYDANKSENKISRLVDVVNDAISSRLT